VFLLLLCNDSQVLGPWVNGKITNALGVVVVGMLVVLSAILMISVLFGSISSTQVIMISATAIGIGVAIAVGLAARGRLHRRAAGKDGSGPAVAAGALNRKGSQGMDRAARDNWRMPPLAMLAPVQMSATRRVGMLTMWAYLGLAFVLVIVRVVEIAIGH
jgi:hypothetical protein